MIGYHLMYPYGCDHFVVALEPLFWIFGRSDASGVMSPHDTSATMITDGVQFVSVIGTVVGHAILGETEVGGDGAFHESLILSDGVFISF